MDSNYGRGGVTSNEDVLRNFCTNTSEVKANNLSTHYDSNSDEILLRQYGVLIAKRKGDKLMITSKRYSVTTSKVQNELLRIAMEYGLDVQKTNEFAKGGKVKSLNDGLEVYAENDLQLKVIQDIIPILDKKGIQLRFAVKVGKFPQSIIFDNHYRDSALVIPGKGYESEYLPVWYDNEFQDANEFENLETNPAPYLPNLDDTDEYARGGKVEKKFVTEKELKKGYKKSFNLDYSLPKGSIDIYGSLLRPIKYNTYYIMPNRDLYKEVSEDKFVLLGKERDIFWQTEVDKIQKKIDENKISRKFGRDYMQDELADAIKQKSGLYIFSGYIRPYDRKYQRESELTQAINIFGRFFGRAFWNNMKISYSAFLKSLDSPILKEAWEKLEDYKFRTSKGYRIIIDKKKDTVKMIKIADLNRFKISYPDLYKKYLKFEDGGDIDAYAKGGDIAQGNYEMILSQAKEVEHHVEELQNILKGEKDIDAWVVAKMENVSSTLSDITHYLDGKTEYAHGGYIYESINPNYNNEDYDIFVRDDYYGKWRKYNDDALTNEAADNLYSELNQSGDYYDIAKEIAYSDFLERFDDEEEEEEYAKGGIVGGYSVVLEADDIKNSSFLNYLKRNGIKHEILSVQYNTAEVKFIGSKEALTKMIDKFWVDMEESEMQEMYDSIQKNEYARGGETKAVEWVVNFTNEFDRGDYVTKYVIAKSEDEAINKGYMEISDDGEESDDYQLSSVYKLSSVKMAKGGMVDRLPTYEIDVIYADKSSSNANAYYDSSEDIRDYLGKIVSEKEFHKFESMGYDFDNIFGVEISSTFETKIYIPRDEKIKQKLMTYILEDIKPKYDVELNVRTKPSTDINVNKHAKGGNIKSKTNKKMATKKVKDGQSAPQTDRWIFAYNKGGYNYYTQKEVPYKKVVDANKKGAPVGYRFSKFAEEKGITNNRFRKPTKSEVEQYAGKKKNGKLIMYRETRSNKSDVNPKKRI